MLRRRSASAYSASAQALRAAASVAFQQLGGVAASIARARDGGARSAPNTVSETTWAPSARRRSIAGSVEQRAEAQRLRHVLHLRAALRAEAERVSLGQ